MLPEVNYLFSSPERRMSPSRQGAAYKWVKDSTGSFALSSWSLFYSFVKI